MTALKYTAAALCFIAALLVGHQNAHATVLYESPALEAKLPLPYKVFVTDDTTASHVHIGVPEIYLSSWAARMLLNGDQYTQDVTQLPWALAIHTLYHEFWHLAFSEPDEQRTDVGALSIMRDMMRRYWGLSVADAQRNYELVAGTTGVARTHYHPVYTSNGSDPLLQGWGL